MKRTSIATVAACLLATPAAAAPPTKCLPGVVKQTLQQLKRFGKVQIISTYRKGARIAGTGRRSKHASCKAVDFHLRGNKSAAIRWLKKRRLEVITYGCGMHHIHIATGSYKAHHCVNRRGVRLNKRKKRRASK